MTHHSGLEQPGNKYLLVAGWEREKAGVQEAGGGCEEGGDSHDGEADFDAEILAMARAQLRSLRALLRTQADKLLAEQFPGDDEETQETDVAMADLPGGERVGRGLKKGVEDPLLVRHQIDGFP